MSAKVRASSLSQVFVVALSSGVAMGLPAHDVEAAPFESGVTCIDIGSRWSFPNVEKLRLRQVVAEAFRSPTGRLSLNTARKAGTPLCYDKALQEPTPCGSKLTGQLWGDKLRLNADTELVSQAKTAVHEARHKYQFQRGISWSKTDGNYREADRIAVYSAMEADSRVISILFAWEMEQAGRPEHLQELKNQPWYAHMVEAFEESLSRKPGDILEASRAAFLTFRSIPDLAKDYDHQVASWIEKYPFEAFEPEMPADVLMTHGQMQALGNLGRYGNYMTPDVMAYIAGLADQDAFDNLMAARVEERKDRGLGESAPVCP